MKINNFFGGETVFKSILERDERKINICDNKNIKLLIIPYTIKKQIDIESKIITFLNKKG